jgi:hypothetical protein
MSALLQAAAGIGLLVWLLFTAVFLYAVYWTYKDASRHSPHPAFLWAIVVFLAPLLGFVLYILLGRK